MVSLVLVCFFLGWEVLQFKALGSKYFGGDNFYDLSIFSLILVVDLWDLIKNEVYSELQWVMFLTMWVLIILKYIRVFKPTRKYVKMIMILLEDVTVFLVMLFVIIFAYMHLLVVLSDGSLSFSDTFKISYTLSFGELDDTRDEGFIEWMNFMIFSFSITLVLMNLLIAIMSDSYEHVMETAVAADIDIILGDIIELEEIFSYFYPVEQKYEYFFISEPLAIADSDGTEVWDGVLGRITKTVKEKANDIRNDIHKMTKNQDKQKSGMDEIKSAL